MNWMASRRTRASADSSDRDTGSFRRSSFRKPPLRDVTAKRGPAVVGFIVPGGGAGKFKSHLLIDPLPDLQILFIEISLTPSEQDPSFPSLPSSPFLNSTPQSSHTNTVSTPPRPRNPNCRLVPPPEASSSAPLASPKPCASQALESCPMQTPSWTWICLGLGRDRSARREGSWSYTAYTPSMSSMSWDNGIRCGP